MDISPSSTLSTFALNLSFFCFLASQQENPCQAQPRISATLQTHRQGEHTCTLWKRTGICIKDTQETKVAKHDRCATTGLTWFLSLGHEALYGTEKRNRYMNVFIISYTALSDNITAEGRQRGTTTVEYFTKQSVKVKKDKDTPSEDWHDSRVLYFWNRLTKQNRESKWKTEGCEAEGASTRYLLTWWNKSPLFRPMTGNRWGEQEKIW